MYNKNRDERIRSATFAWLAEQVTVHGDVLPRRLLADGYVFEGERVPLLGPQGIFKPRVLQDVPLSITTAPAGPYDDSFGLDGLLRYRYRGADPNHPDNRGLRFAKEMHLPLVYFHGIVPGKYLATWPVFIVGDSPATLTFSVAVDDAAHMGVMRDLPEGAGVALENFAEARRAYITSTVRQRLHQRVFRERVLEAYHRQCAFCRLRHEELLDAAHIVPDTEPEGEPHVKNGLALCKLHHSVFDGNFVGLRPDYVVQVREDILREHDGPTLAYAIQALHGKTILLPRHAALMPDPGLLKVRFERFLKAG